MFLKYLIVFLVSMVPLIELRGAIPIAEGMGISTHIYYPIAILGNMLPMPLIFFFARRFLIWGKHFKPLRKFCLFCLNKGEKGGKKLMRKAGKSGIFWALVLFVGVPLPGTGAWTGTLAASILGLDFKLSLLAVTLGVILAGIIMSSGSKIIVSLGWTGLGIIALAIIMIVIAARLIKKIKKKR